MPLLGFTFGFGAEDVGMKNAMNSAESGVIQITEAINKAGKKARTSGLNTFFNGLSSMRLGEVANNTKELANSSGELTSGLESQFIAMDKEVRPIVARFGLVGEEASKTKSEISSLAYSLNTGASQVAEAWTGLKTAGESTREVFKEMGLGLKELVKLEATTGVSTKELSHTVADLFKSWSLNKDQVKGVLSGLTKVSTASGRAGKAFGDLKANMSALTDIYGATNIELSGKEVAHLAVQTEKLAGVFVHGLGTSVDDAGQKALGVMKKMAEEQTGLNDLMTGLSGKYSDFFTETAKASGFGDAQELLDKAARDPVKALSLFQKMWGKLQESGDTQGMNRFSKVVSSIGPDFAFLAKGGEGTTEAIKKMGKASIEGSGSLKKLAEAGHSTGLTMQDKMDRMKEHFQQNIRDIAKDSVGGFVERQQAGYDSLKKSLNKYADAPGWGTIIKRMSLISQVGVTGMVMPMKKSLAESAKEANEVSKALGKGGILGRLKALKAGGFKTLGVEAGASMAEAGNQMSEVQDKLTGFAILAGQVGSAMAHLGKTLMPLIIAMPAIKGVVGGLGGAFVGLIKAVSGIGGVLMGAFGFLFSLPGLIIGALAAVFFIFTDYGEKIRETIKKYFVKGVEAIFGKDVFKNVGTNLTSSFSSMFESVFSVLRNIGKKVWGALKGIFNQMAEGFSKAGQWLAGNASAIKDVAGSILGFIGNALKYVLSLLPKVIGLIGDFAVSLVEPLKKLFVNVFDQLFSWLKSSMPAIKRFSIAITDLLLSSLRKAGDLVGKLFGEAVGLFQLVVDKLAGAFQYVFNNAQGIFDFSALIIGKIEDSISSIVSSLEAKVKEAVPKLKDTASTIFTTLANGVSVAVPLLVRAIQNAFAKIPGIVKKAGEYLSAAFEFGVLTPFRYVIGKIKSFLTTEAVSNFVNGVFGFFNSASDAIFKGIKNLTNTIMSMAINLSSSLKSAVKDIGETLTGIDWNGVWENFTTKTSSLIKSSVDKIVSTSKTMSEKSKSLTDSLVSTISEAITQSGNILASIDFGVGFRGAATKLGDAVIYVFDGAVSLALSSLDMFGNFLEGIGNIYDSLGDAIRSINWAGLGKNLVDFIFIDIPKFIWKALVALVKGIIKLVKAFFTKILPKLGIMWWKFAVLIGKIILSILEFLGGIAIRLGVLIFKGLYKGISWLSGKIGELGSWLGDVIYDAFGPAIDGLSNFGSDAWSAIKGVGDYLWSGIVSLGGMLDSAGEAMFGPLWNGMKRIMGNIWSWVKGVWGKLKSWLNKGVSKVKSWAIKLKIISGDDKYDASKEVNKRAANLESSAQKANQDALDMIRSLNKKFKVDTSSYLEYIKSTLYQPAKLKVGDKIVKGKNIGDTLSAVQRIEHFTRFLKGLKTIKKRAEASGQSSKEWFHGEVKKLRYDVLQDVSGIVIEKPKETGSYMGGGMDTGKRDYTRKGEPITKPQIKKVRRTKAKKAVKTKKAEKVEKKETTRKPVSTVDKDGSRDIVSTFKSVGGLQVEILQEISKKLGGKPAPRYAQRI